MDAQDESPDPPDLKRFLFIHQNFPGQFKHLAPALAAEGHQVVALTIRSLQSDSWNGVRIRTYKIERGTTPNVHSWVSDFETKTIRGEALFKAALELKREGFSPDVIVAHPGWGESLFVKDVWPEARLAIYCEFHYQTQGADVGFDPEFQVVNPGESCRLRLKNLNNLLHFEVADAGISPTHWQASTFPSRFRSQISVIHDGIDTETLSPNRGIHLTLPDGQELSRDSEVVTFVNRNLEPYRGYHSFMRALPHLLSVRPNAHVLIVGGNDVSYGARPPGGKSWRDIFLEEVRERLTAAQLARIHYLGSLPYQHFIGVMQLSTVHVYLTYPFVLSWSLLEAMSMECSIVASDTAPVREAIIDGKTGRLVDFFKPYELASAVVEMIGDPKGRAQLGENARNFAREHYDLRSVCLPRQLAWVHSL